MGLKSFIHSIHGDKLHDTVIFLIKRHIINCGGTIKDTKVFRDRACVCEPDIYYEIGAKRIDGNRRNKIMEIYVIEVETNPTNESRLKKYEQYREKLVGLTDLIVIDMSKDYIDFVRKFCADTDYKVVSVYHDYFLIEKFIEERVPI